MKFLTITLLLVTALTGSNCIQAMHQKNSTKENILRFIGKTSKDQADLTNECLLAIINNDIKTVNKILKIKDFNVNYVDKSFEAHKPLQTSKAPLHTAAQLGNLDMVKLLIKRDADVNVNDGLLCISPLAFAILSATSNPKVIQELINAGANVNARFTNRYNFTVRPFDNDATPLHLAAKVLNIPALEILLDQPNINLHAKTQDKNQTPLELVDETDGKFPLMGLQKTQLDEQELEVRKNKARKILTRNNTLKDIVLKFIRKNKNLFTPEALNTLPIELREEVLG